MMKSWILAAGLEASGFEPQVSFRDGSRHPSEQTAEHTFEPERQACPAAGRGRLDQMMADHPEARGRTHPGEARAALNRGDLPQRRRKSRLSDHGPRADGERPPAESLDARHGRGPFVPPVRVAHHLPNAVGGRSNVDRCVEYPHRIMSEDRSRIDGACEGPEKRVLGLPRVVLCTDPAHAAGCVRHANHSGTFPPDVIGPRRRGRCLAETERMISSARPTRRAGVRAWDTAAAIKASISGSTSTPADSTRMKRVCLPDPRRIFPGSPDWSPANWTHPGRPSSERRCSRSGY